jgi:spore germination protein YaaH
VDRSARSRCHRRSRHRYAGPGRTHRQSVPSAAGHRLRRGRDGHVCDQCERRGARDRRRRRRQHQLQLLSAARSKQLRAEFLVGNYSAAIGDFDSTAAHDLVSSKTNTAHVVASLVKAVTAQGWDGVTVDLEAVNGRDRAGLVSFVTALKAAMPPGKTVSLDVTAYTSAQEYMDNGYDLAALGSVLDRVALMAYDEHGPTWNGVGPIGGLPWQRQCLEVLLTQVPAAKVDLGVAGYGYTWPTHGTGVQVSDSQARTMVQADGSTAGWNAAQGEWTATLHNGTVLWWSDAKSWPLRESLAQTYNLHGLALWSLGLSDPLSRRATTHVLNHR